MAERATSETTIKQYNTVLGIHQTVNHRDSKFARTLKLLQSRAQEAEKSSAKCCSDSMPRDHGSEMSKALQMAPHVSA